MTAQHGESRGWRGGHAIASFHKAASTVTGLAKKLTLAVGSSAAALLLIALIALVVRLVFTRHVEVQLWHVSDAAKAKGLDAEQATRLFADELAAVASTASQSSSNFRSSRGAASHQPPQASFSLPTDDLPRDFKIESADISVHDLVDNIRWLIGLRPPAVRVEASVLGDDVLVTVHVEGFSAEPLRYPLAASPASRLVEQSAKDAAAQAITILAPHNAAVFFYLSGQLQRAENMLLHLAATEDGRDQAQAVNLLGLIALAENRPDEAELRFKSSLAIDPSYVEAQSNLGLVAERRGDRRDAEATYRNALARDGRSVPALVNLGRVLIENGNKADGINDLRLAIKIQPDNAIAHANLAQAVSADFDAADREYQAAAGLAPSDGSIRFGWGLLYFNRANRCVETFRQKPASGSAECLSLLRSAENHLLQAAARSVDDGQVQMALGDTYYQAASLSQGRVLPSSVLERALNAYETAARIDAAQPDAAFKSATVLLALGRNAEAVVAYNRALSLDPGMLPRVCETIRSVGASTDSALDPLRRRCAAR